MRISDWSSDVCSSDLLRAERDLDLPDVARKINAANGWGKVARRRRALTGEALPEFVPSPVGAGMAGFPARMPVTSLDGETPAEEPEMDPAVARGGERGRAARRDDGGTDSEYSGA